MGGQKGGAVDKTINSERSEENLLKRGLEMMGSSEGKGEGKMPLKQKWARKRRRGRQDEKKNGKRLRHEAEKKN